MIKCTFCSTIYPENTLFCEECGSFLDPRDDQATSSLESQVAERLVPGGAGRAGAKVLELSIEGEQRIELPFSKDIILGRLDPSQGSFPDVDLSKQGAKKGVSRQHACLTRYGDEIFVKDLNSMNGTFLNANRVVPEQPYPVRDGDQIQLGKLTLTVHLKPTNGRDR
jgi:pSer/pThr/pTyr-binding forkhead associated (FHA) protein